MQAIILGKTYGTVDLMRDARSNPDSFVRAQFRRRNFKQRFTLIKRCRRSSTRDIHSRSLNRERREALLDGLKFTQWLAELNSRVDMLNAH
jgi:hypothetical protein